jgi:hypothetical protein
VDEWRALLGRKVSLRYRLHGDAAYPFSEAVGVVQAVDDDVVKVLSRRAELVSVVIEDVLAAKVFVP